MVSSAEAAASHVLTLMRIGPIIRITPDELHILDSDYYEQLYANSGRLDKYEWMSGRFGTAESFFNSGTSNTQTAMTI